MALCCLYVRRALPAPCRGHQGSPLLAAACGRASRRPPGSLGFDSPPRLAAQQRLHRRLARQRPPGHLALPPAAGQPLPSACLRRRTGPLQQVRQAPPRSLPQRPWEKPDAPQLPAPKTAAAGRTRSEAGVAPQARAPPVLQAAQRPAAPPVQGLTPRALMGMPPQPPPGCRAARSPEAVAAGAPLAAASPAMAAAMAPALSAQPASARRAAVRRARPASSGESAPRCRAVAAPFRRPDSGVAPADSPDFALTLIAGDGMAAGAACLFCMPQQGPREAVTLRIRVGSIHFQNRV